MLLRTGPPNWSHSCRRPFRASGMQQGCHPCLQRQHPTRTVILQLRQPLIAPSAAATVAQSQELQQLQVQQQLQQMQVPLRRPADAVTSFTSNGHGPGSISSSRSTVPQFVSVPSPRYSSYTAQQTPISLVSLLVIEAFAGSYSAGRLTARLNSSNTGMSIAAYAAVELDPAFMQRAPDSAIFGIPDHENRTMIINGSITDPAVHGKLLRFVQQMLQQSADGSGPVIDGVMLLGGPPCTMYSNCQTYQLPLVIEPDPDSFRRKLFASDRVVTGFLQLYSIIKTACADTRWPHPSTRQSVPSCILMENPFSPSYMPIKYTPQEIAASQGQLKPRQIKMIEKQNLSGRHFLQPYLAHSGGELYMSLHCWCSYAHLTHPKKPTYVFSDLKGLQDTPCICRLCRPEGRNLKSLGAGASGRLIEVPVYQQHYVKVQEMETGDGGERATWPDAWLDRMAWLFSTSILAQRHFRYSSSSSSSSSGRSSCDSGSSGLRSPVHGRPSRCSSTAAGNGSSTAAAGNVDTSKLTSSFGSCDAAAAAAVDAALLGRRGGGPSRIGQRRSRESSSSSVKSSGQTSATSGSGQSSNACSSTRSITSRRSGQSSASSGGQQVNRQHDRHNETLEPSSIDSSGKQSNSATASNKGCAVISSGQDSNAASSSGDCITSSSGGQGNASSSSRADSRPSSRSSTGSSGNENSDEVSNSSRRRARGDSSSRASSSISSASNSSSASSVSNAAASNNSSTISDQDRRVMERHRQLPSVFDLPL